MKRRVPITRLQAVLLGRVGVPVYRVVDPAEDKMSTDDNHNTSAPGKSILPPEVVAELQATRGRAAAPPRNVNRLDQKEYFKLYKYLEANVPTLVPPVSRQDVALAATKTLGFKVTEWHIYGALETTGLALPELKPDVPLHEKVAKTIQALDELILVLIDCTPSNAIGDPFRRFGTLRDELRDLL